MQVNDVAPRAFLVTGHRLSRPRSRVLFEWFDAVGLDDLPAVFAGRMTERIDIQPHGQEPPGVVLAAIAFVEDVTQLGTMLRGSMKRLASARIRSLWIYQAFDDEHEAMILHEIDDEDHARRWIDHPGVTAQWMSRAGLGAGPPLFVGRLVSMMQINFDLDR